MNKPLVIQLLGQARSGKDWTAEQLKAYYESKGKSVEIMSYALPMKRITATLFDIDMDTLNQYKDNPTDVSIEVYDNLSQGGHYKFDTNFRTILQRMGNEAMKSEFGNSVWADLMKANIDKSKADIILIPDCRFNVELDTIGGITVRIINRALPAPMNHASELELLGKPTDFTINNTDYTVTEQEIAHLGKRILDES